MSLTHAQVRIEQRSTPRQEQRTILRSQRSLLTATLTLAPDCCSDCPHDTALRHAVGTSERDTLRDRAAQHESQGNIAHLKAGPPDSRLGPPSQMLGLTPTHIASANPESYTPKLGTTRSLDGVVCFELTQSNTTAPPQHLRPPHPLPSTLTHPALLAMQKTAPGEVACAL
jgi:hypothetical protein